MGVRPDIEINIEELVLHGFRRGDEIRIAQAVRDELTRLLLERGVPPHLSQGMEIGILKGPAIGFNPSMRAEITGCEIGRSVFDSFNGLSVDRN